MAISRFKGICLISLGLLLASCEPTSSPRPLSSFTEPGAACYDRSKEPYTSVVDSHIHFRGFGGPSIPFSEVAGYLESSGVRFANVNGIGQVFPDDTDCVHYFDCPGLPLTPSIKNDFINAAHYLQHKPNNIHLTLSMTFPDLTKPDQIVELIDLYDNEYPGLFKWMGEVNLMKQALLNNHHEPVTIEDINQWPTFMAILKERQIPINIHADLGNDLEPTKYLFLMEHVLNSYPDNKIVWAHMGLSLELTKMPVKEHIAIMESLLDQHDNLMFDISWRLLYDHYFSNPEHRDLYVAFLNEYSDRILPGSDFVASSNKNIDIYQEELKVNSYINQYLNDEAFRNIALGENYFRLLSLDYHTPQICQD